MSSEAEDWKKKGNDAFKIQSWDEAIKCYNKAITLDPNNATYYSNRSGAWSAKGSHENALSDANKCLSSDSNFVKGYCRKGKALFDLNRWDEAEEAYKAGLSVDAGNEGCSKGIADIQLIRQHKSSSSGGGIFGSAGLGSLGSIANSGFVKLLIDKVKGGGTMQKYLMMFVAYQVFTTLFSGKKPSTSQTSMQHAVGVEDDDADAVAGGQWRSFAEVEGKWLSYVQSGHSKSNTLLLAIHRTSLSAEAEFGTAIAAHAMPKGVRLTALDRPCHGFSPCPQGGEPDGAPWLDAFLSSSAVNAAAVNRLVLATSGREAALQALAFASRQEDARELSGLVLLSPGAVAPARPAGLAGTGGARELSGWVASQEHSAATALAAADVARWAAASEAAGASAATSPTPPVLNPGELSKQCQVFLLYGDGEEEDETLRLAFESKGAKVETRSSAGNGAALLDTFIAEALRLASPEPMGDGEEVEHGDHGHEQ
eukprot:gnl/TRDRNA2_/TRDRNA2_175013_c0_seq1.p1 gnl/TRDRNA2_/TRDRNA2_175013_c0~~gnl/TRDRNA2_/TRDRNA2_175013_c0_seq1.p1  ORF type:complete len:484 (+),score=93.58 gnl/TRDRNA2_/TRDRNA2_175013_c0_seq1:79-1530(+)